MDGATHFLFVLAAVLIIVCCLLWLAGSACLLGKSHRIRKDIDTLFDAIKELGAVAKKFAGGLTRKVSGSEGDAEMYTEAFSPQRSLKFPPPEYPPENDDRYWRDPTSQYHFPYFE